MSIQRCQLAHWAETNAGYWYFSDDANEPTIEGRIKADTREDAMALMARTFVKYDIVCRDDTAQLVFYIQEVDGFAEHSTGRARAFRSREEAELYCEPNDGSEVITGEQYLIAARALASAMAKCGQTAQGYFWRAEIGRHMTAKFNFLEE